LALNPEGWEIHYNLARALEEARDAKAEEHFDYALYLSPQPATVHHEFEDAATTRGNFTIALEQYQSALVLEPQRRRAQIGLGKAQMRLGQSEQALREFADVSAKVGTDIQLLSELATVQWGLDPVPYNGGTTTCQTLWMGVPVVTLAGENFCASMNASILQNLGLDEHIAESEDDYVLATVRLAEDAPRRVELRIGLLETILNAPSCDPVAFTLNL
jgi:tetratricopeptide (TPR) repeat protein